MRNFILNSCLLLVFALAVNRPVSAQRPGGVLRGIIISAGGTPAPDVTIQLKHLRRATVSDESGFFILKHLPAFHDTLVITSVDSKTYVRDVVVDAGRTVDIGTISLQYNIAGLQNVEITGQPRRSYKSGYSFFGNKTETPVHDVPQSISTITKELLQDKMEYTVKEAVDIVAGVNQYSGYDEYTIRGFRAENAHDINGLRGYNTSYTSSLLVNIERIEVVKGPTATLYGNCDPGGTINLVTKKPLQKTQGELSLYGGSWDHFRAEGDLTGPINKTKSLLYRMNAGYDKSNSFRNGLFSNSWQLAPSFTFIPNGKIQVNLDFSLSHIQSVLDRGQPGFLNDTSLRSTPINLSLIQPGDYLHETDLASIATVSYQIKKRLSFNAGLLDYITDQKVANHLLNSFITDDSVNLGYTQWKYQTITNTLTTYLAYQLPVGKAEQKLLLGYDYVSSTVDLQQQYYEVPGAFGAHSGIVGTFSLRNPVNTTGPVSQYKVSDFNSDPTNVEGEEYRTAGFYLQDQVSLRKWKFLFNLREEFYKGDEDDSAASPGENVFLYRIGMVYALKPNLSFYATINRGFDPFEVSIATQVFNAPFKPLISQLWEIGAKQNLFSNKLSTSIALYQLRVRNVAVNANIISNPNLFVQQGEDQSRGFEAEAYGNVLPNLSVAISYAYCLSQVLKSKNPSEIGHTLENAPRSMSDSWIKYSITRGPFKGFGLSGGYSLVSRRSTLEPGVSLASYFIANAGLQYRWQHFAIAVILNNITNKEYWTAAYNGINKWPGAPRSFMVNLNYSFDEGSDKR